MMRRAKWNNIYRRSSRLWWLLIAVGCTTISVSMLTTTGLGASKDVGEFVQKFLLLVAVAIGIAMTAIVVAAWPVRGWFNPPYKWMR